MGFQDSTAKPLGLQQWSCLGKGEGFRGGIIEEFGINIHTLLLLLLLLSRFSRVRLCATP